MIFVDETRIFVQAGHGGNGCESYIQLKHMRHKRPDGGDGGRGGSIVLRADNHVQTLLDFRYQQHHKADRGGHASSKGKTGRNAKDCVLRVPVGTLVKDVDSGLLMKDLVNEGDEVIVAKGGSGGLGNLEHKEIRMPEMGEERWIKLELKVIADVGLIGFPNAGKSTIISAISKVKSKIANYPFTTKQPILGYVTMEEDWEDFSFVVADLPGLIEGAAEGKGMGHKFLKHAERTKILVHVVDMAGQDMRDPLEDYVQINQELSNYSEELDYKHQIVVANKMDEEAAAENLEEFKKKFPKTEVLEVSALEKTGLDQLISEIKKLLVEEKEDQECIRCAKLDSENKKWLKNME